MNFRRKRYALAAGLSGALVLCAFSVFQKKLIGAPMAPRGFIVPGVFGFLAGAAIGYWHGRVAELKRRLETEVRETARQVQSILNIVPLGIAEIDSRGRFLFNNESYGKLVGYGEDELVGETVFSFLPDEESADELGKHLKRLREERPPPEPWLGRNVTRDGRLIDVEVFWDYKRGDDGEIDGFIFTVMDVTERRRAEKALRESDEKFRLAFDSSPDAVNINRLNDGLYVEVNQGFTRLTGFTPEDVIGKTSYEIDIWNDISDRDRLVRGLLRDGYYENLEADFKRKDGSVTTALMSARLVTLNDTPHILSITRDISRIKEVEGELRKAKEEAEAANRSKSEFLANMSHELRTPLNGIMGVHQLLRTTELDAEQNEYVTVAIRSARRLTDLLGDILDLSKVEAGRMEISVEPFDLRETMGLAEQLFLPGCEQKGVKFEAHVDEAVPGMLAGDKSRLLQVLNNLIGNAVKFTEEGSIRVSAASLPATPDGRPRVLFSVEDTGIGIRDEDLSSLFEPFTQADGGYRRKYQGAGLGLSIVRRLVELMGGSMAVAGEPGVGAEFHFCLPFDTVSGPGEEAGGLRKVCAGGRNLCVLVVEDDVVNRMVMQRLLEKNECEVGVAENGERALEKLRDRHFDAVLMDVQMPVMDGVEATRAIREGGAGEDRSGIPIIALTAYAMSGDREKFLDSGMNGYLAKPVEETDLRVELERVVNGVEPGGAGPE